ELLDALNQGSVFGTAEERVGVGGCDTSIDGASVARRLGHITRTGDKNHAGGVALGFTATDIAGTLRRHGMSATLTSLFPIEGMTAAERERQDALREGVDIMGSVMPLEVLLDAIGKARALKMCECDMDGMRPIPKEGTEFEIECDIIISAIGQTGDFSGIEEMDGGNKFIATDALYKVKDREKHFAGGDIVKPHLLTTAIGHGRVAAECIDHFLAGEPLNKRPKVDVHHFNLLQELHQRELDPAPYDHTQTRGTSEENFAIHNYEDRSNTQIIPHNELFKGHFGYLAREQREEVHITGDDVLGNFEERIRSLTEEQAQKEGERCMNCGMCLECNNCIIFCPQDAVHKVKKSEYAVGRYVYTDYGACIGCHICMDVCPSGYIKMGLGE
ncbi:MAG: 4Fe-4S dicluster domain-containing protein, partial [Alphaproteobacteria bacterium]|nr:4Fe-4S dicluster domain-containing protein [Alphaproteobacteria bacterium]